MRPPPARPVPQAPPAQTGAGAPSGATGPGGPAGAARFAAVRECLQKNGVTLPQRPAGGGAPHRGAPGFLGGSGAANGGPTLPKGMTRAQYAEVLKKCGGGFHGANAFGHARRGFASPTARQALTKFAACLRQNGVNIPEPNTSGKGPIFDTKGIDTAGPQFKQAELKCRNDLLSALRHRRERAGRPNRPGQRRRRRQRRLAGGNDLEGAEQAGAQGPRAGLPQESGAAALAAGAEPAVGGRRQQAPSPRLGRVSGEWRS